jgi:NTE family protein
MSNRKRIGLALSGGGIRAAIFHLGILKWLAENKMLGDVRRISSVSGASLAIGLIYSHNSLKWPTDDEYLTRVLPEIERLILKYNIQLRAIIRMIFTPWNWGRKVNLLSRIIEKYWGVNGRICELDQTPMWHINCTTFETGKRFRFAQNGMGDYTIGYVPNPSFAISEITAASAGFPILIGPYKLKTEGHPWERSRYHKGPWNPPKDKHLYLWDGGVYDNLGMESIFTPANTGELKENIDLAIVCNASDSIGYKKRRKGFSGRNLRRLQEITMDQVRALRIRSFRDYVRRTHNGYEVDIRNGAEKARVYRTTLSKPSKESFDLIFNSGYEQAKLAYSQHIRTLEGAGHVV